MLTVGEIELQSSLKPSTDLSDINILFFFQQWLPDGSNLYVLKMCSLDTFLKPKRVTSFKPVVFNLPLS